MNRGRKSYQTSSYSILCKNIGEGLRRTTYGVVVEQLMQLEQPTLHTLVTKPTTPLEMLLPRESGSPRMSMCPSTLYAYSAQELRKDGTLISRRTGGNTVEERRKTLPRTLHLTHAHTGRCVLHFQEKKGKCFCVHRLRVSAAGLKLSTIL